MRTTNEIHELALTFIETEEMRQCFRDTILCGNTRLTFNPDRDCADFIIGSRASVVNKLAALRRLPPVKETLDLIDAAEAALAELNTAKDNVFLTTLHFPYKTGHSETQEDRVPFLSFESAMKYVQRETARMCEIYEESIEQCMEHMWYEVEKFIPDENNELLHKITLTLNANGEIMFFETGEDFIMELLDRDNEDNASLAWLAWEGSDNWEYPPIPFDFGDIITIDMRPFYEAFRGVIVRIEDNSFCCAVACIHCDRNGWLHCSTLKHDCHKISTKVSPLYRAERFMGELPENERSLKIISEAIKKTPPYEKVYEDGAIFRKHELANQFDDFLYSHDYKEQDGHFGCLWDEFRDRFKL